MIEDLFPKTVGNILDYDAIKLAAKQYVEDVFVNIVQEFADNMTLHTMDAAHLADVAGHVAGDSSLSLEQLLDYINSENIYHECDFVSELLAAFPAGVEYKEFDVTGWGFPESDLFPFNSENRSFHPDGTPMSMQDPLWRGNAQGNLPERNLLMSRYKGQFDENDDPQWHRKEGRRSSCGNSSTWMTSGGFGKPATIHINVDEERTVIEGNGLTAVENWLGTVSNKLPINLYIEIESHFVTNAEPASSSLEGYYMSFPYEEEEGFCTNDPSFSVEPIILPPPPPPPEPEYSFIVVNETTGEVVYSISETEDNPSMVFSQVGHIEMPDSEMILVPEASLPLATFYLNPEGRDATENHTLTLADNPVFDEDGNNILYADYPDLQGNKPFCFMRVDNTFFMGGEGDSLINFSEGKAGIGALASRGKSAWSVSFEVPPSELTAYFTSSGANNRDTDVGRNSFYYLYDENGQRILYDTSKTYTIIGVYKVDGTKLETSTSDFMQASSLGELMWYSNVLPSTGTWYYAYKITYTET